MLITPESAAHYYGQDGAPVYSVDRADGKGTRAPTIRDARALGLRPSVTTVFQVRAKPGLEAWKIEQGILSALTLPRAPGEDDESFARRVVEDSEAQSRAARDLGTALHKVLECWHTGKHASPPPQFLPAFGKYGDWWEAEGFAAAMVEHTFACPYGYGGRIDMTASDMEHDCTIILDWKTQATKPGRAITAYPEWGDQLAAYAHGVGAANPRLFNVVFSSTEPGRLDIYEWPASDHAFLWERFLATFRLWCLSHNYYPMQTWPRPDTESRFEAAALGPVVPKPEEVAPAPVPRGIPGQVAGLRQLATGEGRVTVDLDQAGFLEAARSASVGTMVRVRPVEEGDHV